MRRCVYKGTNNVDISERYFSAMVPHILGERYLRNACAKAVLAIYRALL